MSGSIMSEACQNRKESSHQFELVISKPRRKNKARRVHTTNLVLLSWSIFDSTIFRSLTKDNKPCNIKAGKVRVYLDVVYSILRFPIHPFFCRILSTKGVDSIQVNLNMYCFVSAIYVLYHKLCLGSYLVALLNSCISLGWRTTLLRNAQTKTAMSFT